MQKTVMNKNKEHFQPISKNNVSSGLACFSVAVIFSSVILLLLIKSYKNSVNDGFTSSEGVTTYGGLNTKTSTFPFNLGKRHSTCDTQHNNPGYEHWFVLQKNINCESRLF